MRMKATAVTRSDLEAEADRRYEPGKGPWSKLEDLDQVDLAHFERLARGLSFHSDMRGLLAGCLERLVHEVRRANGWTEPSGDGAFDMIDSGQTIRGKLVLYVPDLTEDMVGKLREAFGEDVVITTMPIREISEGEMRRAGWVPVKPEADPFEGSNPADL